jgi:hypothetical protein
MKNIFFEKYTVSKMYDSPSKHLNKLCNIPNKKAVLSTFKKIFC